MHPADWNDPGLPPDAARAGAIKGGASYHHISRAERRRLEAIAGASAATGAAILVHAEIGTAAHEIIDLLEGAGASADRIALAHLDRNPDAELHAEVAARGVTLEYDTIGRTKYHPDSLVLDLIEAVARAGHLDRLMLGLDLGGRMSFRAYEGGPGMRYLMTAIAPRLRRRLGDDGAARILVANPARFYALPGCRGVKDRYDVVVVGAGSAGSSAAITAARLGASTLLIDRLGFMGGTSTAVLDTFYAFYTPGERPRRVVGGLGWEVARRLTADGVAFERPNTYGAGHRRDVRPRGAQGPLGTPRRGRGRRAAAPHLGDGGPGPRWAAGRGPPLEQGRRTLGGGGRLRRRLGRRGRVRDGGRAARCARRRRGGPGPLHAVQGRERGHRPGLRRSEGGALGADARGRRVRARTACPGSRARGTARRTRASR